MSLKTGELAAAIEQVLAQEYYTRHGKNLPETGKEDRQLLFTAIAGGLLAYLESKQNEFISTIRLRLDSTERTYFVTQLNLNIVP